MDPDTVERARRRRGPRRGSRARSRCAPCTRLDELEEARAIWDAVWPTVPGATEITQNLLRAIEHAGGYVGGAYDGDRMVGSCLAIVGRSQGVHGWHTHLHSHVAAALPGFADRGIGTSLKLHQRAWALRHDIDRIVWTFDPLVRRNARLNLVKLGGVGVEYLVDFYGVMDDALNAGDESDRILLQWDLASVAGRGRARRRRLAALARRVARRSAPPSASSRPTRARGCTARARRWCSSPCPTTSSTIRRFDLALAKVWRLQVRAALEPVVRAGGRVVGLTTDGSYVVEVGS